MITAEQFAEWKTNPVTKEIFKMLKDTKEEIVEQICLGNTIGINAEATHGLTSRAIGHLDGINQLLNISFSAGNAKDDDKDINGY